MTDLKNTTNILLPSKLNIILPYNVILHILQFDNRYVIKNGKFIVINTIPGDDYRYDLLENTFYNNPRVNIYSIKIPDNIHYVYDVLTLYINNEKHYQFTIRFIYINEEIQSRKYLMLHKKNIAIEKYVL